MAREIPAFDAIVVGSRIAGAITAILLAEGGHRVLVLERNRFPSDTLSTHFFRAPALRAFQQIGVLDQVHALAPRLVVDHNVVDGIVFPEPVDGPQDFPYYMCVRRIALDQVLVQRARRTPGLDLREGARVDGLRQENGRVVGVTWSEPGGRQEARASAVIGADGVYSFVARSVKPTHEHQEPVHRAMYYAYLRGIPHHEGPAAEFHYRGDHLVYVFPCDEGLTLAAASVPISEFAEFRRDPDGRLWQELNAMTEVAPRLPRASREG
ncbi:MAG: NAD(P)/FAD-dependent oxidoreductase, partial [Anaerolineales bacterium]